MEFVTTKQDDGQWRVEGHEGGVIVQIRIAKTEAAARKALLAAVYRPDQVKFINKAIREGFELRYDYSGRGMYGRQCPAVVCARGAFGFKGASTDSMGLDQVVYMS